ncbi:MAG: hypothetical protein Q4D12_02175 [Bacteroidales bacterium]|nr:hypothetical protein [Bacteroidales bacterium]
MAKVNPRNGLLTGIAGNLHFKIRGGTQIITSVAQQSRKPRTQNQASQTCKWNGIQAMYSAASGCLKGLFEFKTSTQTDYNIFLKLNLKRGNIYLDKSMKRFRACVIFPLQVSHGSLPSIAIERVNGQAVTDIRLGELEINEETPVWKFSSAVLKNNPLFLEGDEITFLEYSQYLETENIPVPRADASRWTVKLDVISDEPLWKVVPSYAFQTRNGFLAHDPKEELGGFTWIHERQIRKTHSVSSQMLLVNNDELCAKYASEEQRLETIKSYGVRE